SAATTVRSRQIGSPPHCARLACGARRRPRSAAAPVSRDPQPHVNRQNPTILLFSTGAGLGIPNFSRVGLILGILGRGSMILAALLGLSLVSSAAFDPELTTPAAPAARSGTQMSERQKAAVLRPLIRSANDCVAHAVAADPRFHREDDPAEVNEL